VGVLTNTDDNDPVGHVLIEATVYWQRVSGRLRWRRWGAPQQCADVYTLINGNYSESFGQDPELAGAARQWASGHFEGDDGRQYRVTWA